MAHIQKTSIICPVCGKKAQKISPLPDIIYRCDDCGFISTQENCVDVSYKDNFSSPLSNLYPHSFTLCYNHPCYRDVITCPSMESFLQGLKIKDPYLQYVFMTKYSGMMAKKMGMVLDSWKKEQLLYFEGKAYERESAEYIELITYAYDSLYKSNPIFREVVLPRFKDYHIIHSIGCDNKSETVLTEMEFRYQLNRLISKLD